MPKSLADRVLGLKPSATVEMTERVRVARASGRKIIGLSSGDPNIDTDPRIIAAAERAMRQGDTRYGPPAGLGALREAIVQRELARSGVEHDPADVIGSVANYFRSFGWQPGVPPIFPVGFDESRLQKSVLLAPDIVPTFSADAFVAGGAVLYGEALRFHGLLALIELQNGNDPPSYVAGTQNFYVITRYNWSSYYAMSVIELGREIRAAMDQ